MFSKGNIIYSIGYFETQLYTHSTHAQHIFSAHTTSWICGRPVRALSLVSKDSELNPSVRPTNPSSLPPLSGNGRSSSRERSTASPRSDPLHRMIFYGDVEVI